MTFKEYLDKVFEHTEKTLETRKLKSRLFRDFIKQKDEFIERDLIPDEAEDKVLEALPTPDEYREKLRLDVNIISDSDKFFSFFRWGLRAAVIILLLLLTLSSIRYPTDVYYYLSSNLSLHQSKLLMIYISWSLVFNIFATLFLMNKPDSTYGEKVRKHSLIAIGLLTHPIGLPTLIMGLMYSYPRLQKKEYLKKRIINRFRTQKNPVAVYGGTFLALVIIIIGGLSLASFLFTGHESTPMNAQIYFENTEGDRVYQTGSVRLEPIDENTTRIEPYITQFAFETDSSRDLKDAYLTYTINDIDGVSAPIRFDEYLVIENSIVVSQDVQTVIDNFEIHITVTYEDEESRVKAREFLIGETNISNIMRFEEENTYWIWD